VRVALVEGDEGHLYGTGYWGKMKGSARIRLRNGRIRVAELPGKKRTASARKSSNESGTSTRSRRSTRPDRRFVVCIRNDGYEASLEHNKIYEILPDRDAERIGDLRVVDESGEDYLFAAHRFVATDVPAAVKQSVSKASRA